MTSSVDLRKSVKEYRMGSCTTSAMATYGNKQRLQVIDVFESQAKLDAFGVKLMPILQEMGIEAKPTVCEIYNIIEG
jgi:hypothetical protein